MSRRNSLDRLVFLQPGAQAAFITDAKEKLGTDWEELGKIAHAHQKSLRDWAKEKYHMSHESAVAISEIAGVSIPAGAQVRKWSDHLNSIKDSGYRAVVEKYGAMPKNETKRQEKWQLWWDTIGKNEAHKIQNQPLPFRRARRSQLLAEFVGIMLGDGGITDYQLKVTLHADDDKEYGKYVSNLLFTLFSVMPSTRKRKNCNAINIVVSRSELVKYCTELGLVVGNKVRQQVGMPQWVKDDRKLLIACIRGLVDTDGCVFTHKYVVNGKQYSYKKLCFTSHSRPLLLSVFDGLQSLGMNPRIAAEEDVRLDSKRDIQTYFRVIGSSNPKHLNRYYF